MARRYVEEGWLDFADVVFRETRVTPGSTQYIEMRRAFYGGAISALATVAKETRNSTEEEERAIAEAFRDELDEWQERLQKGEV